MKLTEQDIKKRIVDKVNNVIGAQGMYGQTPTAGTEISLSVGSLKRSLGETKTKKKKKDGETDESTGSGSAGGYSQPLFSTTKKEIDEITKGETTEACWKGYEQYGMKDKNGKKVPNCVPIKKKRKNIDENDEITKVETKEATGSASSGSYSTPAAWAKSTSKKDWRGKSKTQIPGGKFVQVKKKCKKFPYCNQGDIGALNLTNESVIDKVIKTLTKKYNLSENVVRTILSNQLNKNK